ncbi:MAG TPA: FliI/YscN family ATPase [Paracoccaceae bacterium]|nr:FliI/YscN family ATPase [Paracoccaceae bacterium]
MTGTALETLCAEVATCYPVRPTAQITEVGRGLLRISATGRDWRMGDRVQVRATGALIGGEVVVLDGSGAAVLTDAPVDGVRLGDRVELANASTIAPHDGWIGRIIDPFGQPLDGRPLMRGPVARDLRAAPPPAASRRRLGARLETGMRVFNTLLPLVRGQRIGLFAGSGVGKSTLMASFARHVQADVAVIALIGERGRELREFVEDALGPEGMARSVVIAATSDQSALVRRRCAWTAMAVAEHFRDQGRQVLFMADSVTRLAEAHREVALAAGEPGSLRGYPPSTSHLIMALAERAGPGGEGAGDITAVFSVLVAGSDMEEPVADILRGVLDGHVVMDRSIAERGRYPAIDLLRSVSRSLPGAATVVENSLIAQARRLLGAYDRAEMMIQAGLYAAGSDPLVDAAIRVWPKLDAYLAEPEEAGTGASFARLADILALAGGVGGQT